MAKGRDDRNTESCEEKVAGERSRACRANVVLDDVVELIVQKIPFPLVLKASALNREWNSKFPRVLSPVCHKWPTYCPAFLSRGGDLLGFDRSDGAWHTIKFEAVRRLNLDNTIGLSGPAPAWALEGVLLCTLDQKRDGITATVVNLLSGKRREIPCPLLEGLGLPIIASIGKEHYRILVLLLEVEEGLELRLSASMYDSRSNSWVHKSPEPKSPSHSTQNLVRRILAGDGGRFPYTYLDGNLYWCYRRKRNRTFCVFRTSLEDGSQTHTPSVTLGTEYRGISESFTCDLLKCGSRIIMVVSLRDNETHVWRVGASIYELDKEKFQLILLSRSPTSFWPDHTKRRTASLLTEFHSALALKSAADNEYIYLCGEHLTSYHLQSDTWNIHGSLPAAAHAQCDEEKLCDLHSVTFEPGLNPFAVP